MALTDAIAGVLVSSVGGAMQNFMTQPYDLERFEAAFELLGQGGNWKFMVKPIARQMMVWVATELDFDEDNESQSVIIGLLTNTPTGKLNDRDVLNCLRKIKMIARAQPR
jgi:hypothetical protein